MPDHIVEFDAAYDDAIIDDAAKTFVRRLFKRYLGMLAAACLLNVVGFIVVLTLPGNGELVTSAIGLLAVLGPVFLVLMHLRFPRKLAAALKQGLKPAVHVSVSSSSFSMLAKDRSFTKQWTDLKAILKRPDYFLRVVAPLAFTFIPKKDVPLAAHQLIREASL